MNTRIFVFSRKYTPDALGMPGIYCQPEVKCARLHDTWLKVIKTTATNKEGNEVVVEYPTVKSSKKGSVVKGKIYILSPTAFKEYQRRLLKRYPRLLRTMCLATNKRTTQYEYKCVTYIADVGE